MSEPLLIGTRGWLHPAWEGVFYPPDLPAEWRLCFYSNRLRAVLVPADSWPAITRAEVEQWVQDSDPLFRFVLEVPADVWVAPKVAVSRLLDVAAPISAQIAGMSLTVPATAVPSELDELLALLTRAHPVCLTLPPALASSPAVGELALRYDAGREWRMSEQSAPPAGGRFLMARMAGGDPRALRAAIDALVAWRGEEGVAGLFIDAPGARSPHLAEQARTLAELMGV